MTELTLEELRFRTSIVDTAYRSALDSLFSQSAPHGLGERNMLLAFAIRSLALSCGALAEGRQYEAMLTLRYVFKTTTEYMMSAPIPENAAT